jgi:hypothetical protein
MNINLNKQEIEYSQDLEYKIYRKDPAEVDAWYIGDNVENKLK